MADEFLPTHESAASRAAADEALAKELAPDLNLRTAKIFTAVITGNVVLVAWPWRPDLGLVAAVVTGIIVFKVSRPSDRSVSSFGASD